MATFADRLQIARAAAGMTYGQIAEAAGVSKTHVWELAQGRVANPTIALTEKLAAALNVEPTWLSGWEDAAVDRAIDRMGWPEIHAFNYALRSGQDVREDAGGYMLRAIKALFGSKPADPVLTYRAAARAMVELARQDAA